MKAMQNEYPHAVVTERFSYRYTPSSLVNIPLPTILAAYLAYVLQNNPFYPYYYVWLFLPFLTMFWGRSSPLFSISYMMQ